MSNAIHVSHPDTGTVQERADRLIAGRQGALATFRLATGPGQPGAVQELCHE